MYDTRQIDKITNASVISRANAVDNAAPRKFFAGLAKRHLQPAIVAERLHFFMNQDATEESFRVSFT